MPRTPRKGVAIHRGHCQLCGSFQKLPGNVLSIHGYTKDLGYHSGRCPGSGYKPYEVSCDRIAQKITRAGERCTALEGKRDAAWANLGPLVFVRNYNKRGKPWEPVMLALNGTCGPLHLKYMVATDEELVQRFNRNYANYWVGLMAQETEYIKWLESGLRNWVPGEVVAIPADEMRGAH